MVLVAMFAVIVGVTLWVVRSDEGAGVAVPPLTSAVSAVATATSEVDTDSTAPVASLATVETDSGHAAPRFAGDPWYWLDLPGVVEGETTLDQPALLAGSSTRIWVSDDDSFSWIVVLHSFATDPGFTTLAGTERTDVNSTDGTAYLLADPADVAETEGHRPRTSSVGFARTEPCMSSRRSASTPASWCASG